MCYQTLTEQWDGTSWSVIPSPNVTAGGDDVPRRRDGPPSNGDVVAVGGATLSNGQSNSVILANNEPSGSTPVGPANPSPSPGTGNTDTEVMGTLTDLQPDQGTKLHKPA